MCNIHDRVKSPFRKALRRICDNSLAFEQIIIILTVNNFSIYLSLKHELLGLV
jgi:hypothetical protein